MHVVDELSFSDLYHNASCHNNGWILDGWFRLDYIGPLPDPYQLRGVNSVVDMQA